jgi:hypothetical protein
MGAGSSGPAPLRLKRRTNLFAGVALLKKQSHRGRGLACFRLTRSIPYSPTLADTLRATPSLGNMEQKRRGTQPEVADPHEASGQHVEEEAAQELGTPSGYALHSRQAGHPAFHRLRHRTTPRGLHQQSDVTPSRLRNSTRSADSGRSAPHNAASGPSRHLYPCTPYSHNRPSAVIARIDATCPRC